MTAGRSIQANSQGAQAGPGLPARRLAGRQVVVLLGASDTALSLLVRTLQALGVDMLDPPAETEPAGAPQWRRRWIGDLNRRLLQAIGRPADHFAHALPFPPGWWRLPAAQALKREAIETLEQALAGHDDLWGFADGATARLLPVWEDVFEQLGLSPVYVWSLTPPAQAPAVAGDLASAAAAAEVRWFAYGADIFRYGADHLRCVVDETDWRSDPQGLIERLVAHLNLRWRGTRLDLYETVGAVLAQGIETTAEARPDRPAALPLSMSFYRSARALEEEPEARERLKAMVDSAELLRPMIAPFLAPIEAAAAGPPADHFEADDPAVLRQEIAALRETCAALRQAGKDPATTPDPEVVVGPGPGALPALEQELQSRVAEIRWLHDRHAAEMLEAEREIEDLRRHAAEIAGAPPVGGSSGAQGADPGSAQAEVARLQAEMVTLTNANERYLARIYELKKALEDHGAFERVGR